MILRSACKQSLDVASKFDCSIFFQAYSGEIVLSVVVVGCGDAVKSILVETTVSGASSGSVTSIGPAFAEVRSMTFIAAATVGLMFNDDAAEDITLVKG